MALAPINTLVYKNVYFSVAYHGKYRLMSLPTNVLVRHGAFRKNF